MIVPEHEPLQLGKRCAPTLVGLALAWLVFIPRLVGAQQGFWFLLAHSLCGSLDAPLFTPSVALTHTDVFFAAVLLSMAASHLFSMRKPTVILSVVGAFLWAASALGHYR
jgi:uncharacterized membrane protein